MTDKVIDDAIRRYFNAAAEAVGDGKFAQRVGIMARAYEDYRASDTGTEEERAARWLLAAQLMEALR